jgi:hypothetical protein
MAQREKVLTPVFRVAFPSVFKARMPRDGKGEPKFELVMLFPNGTDISALKKIAAGAAREKWGDKIPPGLRSPFRDGKEKADLDGYGPGITFVRASTKSRPGVAKKVAGVVQPIIDEAEFYGGCYAVATVHAFAYDNSGNKGVSFGLENVFKVKDGAPFSGRKSVESDFADVDVPETDGTAAPAAAANDPIFGS